MDWNIIHRIIYLEEKEADLLGIETHNHTYAFKYDKISLIELNGNVLEILYELNHTTKQYYFDTDSIVTIALVNGGTEWV